jgi:tetratricopeptide (TPR) repeat protein
VDGDSPNPPGNPEAAARTLSTVSAAKAESDAGAERPAPATLGRYRILRLLGQGGMGAVYEAEQDQPRRVVALKVIKSAWASPDTLRRFELESQALARLQHPGIAQVYEAGTAEAGGEPQPYFAMELIPRGQALTAYAEANRLPASLRLELMAQVCDAVHHAHQRGIIHRDLKPSNILVDESGHPKILDFGVARITDSDARATRQTDLGQLVGTLAYMSPEQALADPLELDTRSDVYALGVVLYELLAGRLPYRLSHKLHEAVAMIREQEPASLSSVSRIYRGDVETIVAKALEKDKGRRYPSAGEMAADIRRYLRDEPILARPSSTGYQLRKFARRHRTLVGAAAAVFLALVAGIAASTWEAVRARRAELMSGTVNDFLQNDLLAQASAVKQARPDTRPDPDLKVRTALDRAAARIGGKFDKEPLVEASIRQTIGEAYKNLGLYPEAHRHLERAVELRRRVLGEKNRDTLASLKTLGSLFQDEDRLPEAEQIFVQVAETQRRTLGAEHPDTLLTLHNLAYVYRNRGKFAQAEPIAVKVLASQRRVLGAEHPDTLASLHDLAALYRNQGKYPQAEPLVMQVVAAQTRVLGAEHPATLNAMADLANVYVDESKYGPAEQTLLRMLEISDRVLGEEHLTTLTARNNLASLYWRQGKYREAGALCARLIEVDRRVLGEQHTGTLAVMHMQALVDENLGQYTEAEALFAKVVEGLRKVLGAEHPSTLTVTGNLGRLLRIEGKYAQAEPLALRVLETQRRVLGEEHPGTALSLLNLALLYQDERKYAQAEPVLEKCATIRRKALGLGHTDTLYAIQRLGSLYRDEGKYARAEAALREAVAGYEKVRPSAWEKYQSESLLGASLMAQQRYAEAEPLLLSGYRGLIQQEAAIPMGSRQPWRPAGEWIVELYRAWGKTDQVSAWRAALQAKASAGR